ncbi:hypothetical protein PVAG01_01383 [Phlyctema vagabunda]|uniref:Uncharacterized protein n=1 Tax=Phlyctema vagabunda TaxID=108571 RepID=A0ABR4PWY1_9HELO
MARRPARLNLVPHAPSKPSPLSHPVSPRSPATPLIPPRRLHLRSVLPSPPVSPARVVPAPPPFPYPWVWRCHLCRTTYALAVTRRCLEDGHYFCSFAPAPAVGKRRRPPRSCTAQFDYAGWERYNHWRREVSLLKAKKAEKAEKAGKEYEYRTSKNCWEDCDFPSECLGEPTRVVKHPSIPEMVEDGEDEDDDDDDEDDEGDDDMMDYVEEEPNKSQSEKEGEMWRELVTDEVWDEEDEKEVRRKKSLSKIQQLTGVLLTTDIPLVIPTDSPESPPSSPLKKSSSVDEQDTSSTSIWDGQPSNEERRGSGDSVDVHLQDLLRTRDMFLRRFEGGYQDDDEDTVM